LTIKKRDFLLNVMMFCLGATVGRRIGDPYLMRHLAAKSADLMLLNLPHSLALRLRLRQRSLSALAIHKVNGRVRERALVAKAVFYQMRRWSLLSFVGLSSVI
jgi:hypothetical protein